MIRHNPGELYFIIDTEEAIDRITHFIKNLSGKWTGDKSTNFLVQLSPVFLCVKLKQRPFNT